MKEVVLGLYVPIISLAMPAMLLLLGGLTKRHADESVLLFKLALVLMLAAAVGEQVLYSMVRAHPEYAALNEAWIVVGGLKALILSSLIVLCSALAKSITGVTYWHMWVALSAALWAVSVVTPAT